MKNENGLAFVILIGLLPLFIGLFLALFSMKAWFLPELELRHLCREGLLRTQFKAVSHLEKLLNLNERVRHLRQLYTQADLAQKAAYASTNPGAIAAASAFRQSVLAAQKILRTQQLYYLSQANLALFNGTRTTKSAIENSINEYTNKYQSFLKFSGQMNFTWPHALAVRATQTSVQGPPIYEPESPFTEKQSLQLSWRYSLSTQQTGVSQWLQTNLSKIDSCRASLTVSKEKFQPTLVADKFWQN